MSFQLTSSAKHAQLLSNILTLYLSNDTSIHQNLPFVLDIILNHRLFDESSEPSEELAAVHRKWTVRMNALLQSKVVSARWCGIVLIKVTCENSHALLLANAKTWSAQLLGFIGKSEPTIIHKEAIETLSFLFSYTVDKPELQREVATPSLQRYNQLLLQLGRKQELLRTVLAALTANVKCFPSTARHISEQCLQLCLSCLDGSRDLDDDTVKEANKCLVSLYNAGGKSVMAEQWTESLCRLIGSIHESLNRLFDTIDEESLDSDLPKSYPFLPVSTDYVAAFPVLLKRIQLIQDCISTFITTSTSIVVGVPVVHLVDLICRIYNVFEGSLMRDYKDKSEFFTLMMCLPALHLSTSKMFTSLLYCSGQEMARYGKLFSRILLRLLSEHKHKRTIKTSVYNLISLCLDKCGYSFAENIHKPLISAILEDLRIIEHKGASLVTTNQQQKKSHKKRKTEVTNSDSLTSKLVSSTSTDVQVAALQTLSALIEVYGFSLENAQRSLIDSTVLSRLIQMVHPSNMSDEEIILVKQELYKCLIASVTHPIETQASIIPHACRLFSAGLNDASHELQLICKKGLSVCDLIMHARLPPIQRALPKESPSVVVTVQEMTEDAPEKEAVEEIEEPVKEKVEVPAPITPSPKIEKVTEVKHIQKEVVIEEPVIIKETVDIPALKTTPVEPPVVETAKVEVVQKEVVIEEPAIVKETVDIPTSKASPKPAAESDEDMDFDMDMPMIDMAGPDSEDDE